MQSTRKLSPQFDQIKVLCFFRYWVTANKESVEYSDSLMISVNKMSQVYETFMTKIRSHIARWGYGWVGPRPTMYELCGWISEDGTIRKLNPGTKIH